MVLASKTPGICTAMSGRNGDNLASSAVNVLHTCRTTNEVICALTEPKRAPDDYTRQHVLPNKYSQMAVPFCCYLSGKVPMCGLAGARTGILTIEYLRHRQNNERNGAPPPQVVRRAVEETHTGGPPTPRNLLGVCTAATMLLGATARIEIVMARKDLTPMESTSYYAIPEPPSAHLATQCYYSA